MSLAAGVLRLRSVVHRPLFESASRATVSALWAPWGLQTRAAATNTLQAPAEPESAAPTETGPSWRVCKFIARYSELSRRQAEALVERGEVFVAGRRVQSPAEKVDPDTAEVRVGKLKVRAEGGEGHGRISAKLPRLFLAYKLPGEIVTRKDPEGRKTFFDRLGAMSLPKGLKSVGRLDVPSEGLLLLTDDGGFSRFLEHPAARIKRTYRVRVFGTVTAWKLRQLRRGLQIGKEQLRPMDVSVEGGAKIGRKLARAASSSRKGPGSRSGPDKSRFRPGSRSGAGRKFDNDPSAAPAGLLAPRGNVWLRVQLSEGRNREIRRAMSACSLHVGKLIRIGYGPYELSQLPRGGAAEVSVPEAVWERARGWLEGGETTASLRAPDERGLAGRVKSVRIKAASSASDKEAEAATKQRRHHVAEGLDRAANQPKRQQPEASVTNHQAVHNDHYNPHDYDDGGEDKHVDDDNENDDSEGEDDDAEDDDDDDDDEAWAELARSTLDELKSEQHSRAAQEGPRHDEAEDSTRV